jgi:hypothetical protein
MRCVFTLGFIFCAILVGFSQEKNEVERRIKSDEVHDNAKEWLKETYKKRRKTKWYYQTDGNKEVFEAKLKHNKQLHSIEFSLDGQVQNIEILIGEDELDTKVLESILKFLDTNYTKSSVSKLQIQYTGDEDDLEDVIDEQEFEDVIVKYEMEFYGKNDKDDELWEALFDEHGKLIQKRIINLKATDNLDY